MSASEVSLTLQCDNPAAELLVIDGNFKLLAHGPTPLITRLEPGIYSLKAKIGGQTRERLEVLEANDAGYTFMLEAPAFESSMPLVATATNRMCQQSSVEQFTQAEPQVALGEGSALVLYVRDTSQQNPQATERDEAYVRGFAGFRLLNSDGEEIVDFDEHAVRHIKEGYIGAQIQLAPGSYTLAWLHDGQQLCIGANTVPDWCLQIYLRLQPTGQDRRQLRPDFCDAAVVFDRLHNSYSASRPDHRHMEALRLALLDRRNVVRGEALQAMLAEKFENPMFGIYGAHLLVAQRPVNTGLLEQALESTASLLGPSFPDLVALWYAYELHSGKPVTVFDGQPWGAVLANLKGPPLLVQSWDLLCHCADKHDIDMGALPAFKAAGNVRPSGVFLTWQQRQICKQVVEPATILTGADATEPVVRSISPIAPTVTPGGTGGVPARGTGFVKKIGVKLWEGFLKQISAQSAGTVAPPLKVDLRVEDITTLQQAIDALKSLQKKAPWPEVARVLYSTRTALEGASSLTALQYDLISTLARVSVDPEILEALDQSYIQSLMRAHRVPLQTIARALRGLDIIAFSAEFIRRLKASGKNVAAKV